VTMPQQKPCDYVFVLKIGLTPAVPAPMGKK